MNIVGFIGKIRADPVNLCNYCRITMSTYNYTLEMIKVKFEKCGTTYRRVERKGWAHMQSQCCYRV